MQHYFHTISFSSHLHSPSFIPFFGSWMFCLAKEPCILTGFLIHSRFAAEDGKQKSVVQYFLEKYNIRLRFASWPALQSGNDSRPIFLPMEVYYILPWLSLPLMFALLLHLSLSTPSHSRISLTICYLYTHRLLVSIQCCKIIEGQRYSKKLNEKQVTALLREACRRPVEREHSIEQVIVIVTPTSSFCFF